MAVDCFGGLWGICMAFPIYIVLENRYCYNGVAFLYGWVLQQTIVNVADGKV